MAIKFKTIPYNPLRVTSYYGSRNTDISGASTEHKGIDIGRNLSLYPSSTATDGGDVVAVYDGVVTTSSYSSVRGNYIIIDHGTIDGKNVKTLYQHLANGTRIDSGKEVVAGSPIGHMGNTGTGSAIHLHFEVHLNNVPVNPLPYIQNLPYIHVKEEEEMTQSQFNAMFNEAYNTIDPFYKTLADVPEAFRKDVKDLIDKKIIVGDGVNEVGKRYSVLQAIIIAKRIAESK